MTSKQWVGGLQRGIWGAAGDTLLWHFTHQPPSVRWVTVNQFGTKHLGNGCYGRAEQHLAVLAGSHSTMGCVSSRTRTRTHCCLWVQLVAPAHPQQPPCIPHHPRTPFWCQRTGSGSEISVSFHASKGLQTTSCMGTVLSRPG